MKWISRDDSIQVLNLSVRSSNALCRAGILTVGALLDYPMEEFLHIRNMGTKSVLEITEVIDNLNKGQGDFALAYLDAADSKEPLHPPIAERDELTVYINENGAIIQDVPIEKLGFNNRAFNRFNNAGLTCASMLLGTTKEDLLNMSGMGEGTVDHAYEIISNIKVEYIVSAESDENQTNFFQSLLQQLLSCYGESKGFWSKIILCTKEDHPEAYGESFIYYLYAAETVRSKVKNVILTIIEEHNDQIAITKLESVLPDHLFNTTIVKELLIELENSDLITFDDEFVSRRYPTVIDYANSIEDEKLKNIFWGRMEGKTFDEIGKPLSLTRERVRQQIEKVLSRRPKLAEDKYAYLFENYNFSLEDFLLAFNEPVSTYHYLCEVCLSEHKLFKMKGISKKSIDKILEDDNISPKMRKQAERAIYKNYILLDGRRVKIERAELVKCFLREFCTELIKYDDFVELFNLWIEDIGLSGKKNLYLDCRAHENHLVESNYILWHHGRRLRYYDIETRDFSLLLEAIDFSLYNNMEISALKIFRDYPEIMKEYDLRDEYELHYLLRKVLPKNKYDIKFGRMPNIEIGTINRENQVVELLRQYAPISVEEFSAKYEEAYGIKATTVAANYLAVIDKYLSDGVYAIDFEDLPENEFLKLKSVLTEDYYTIDYIKHVYGREFPKSDISNINTYALKSLGFKVYTGYVISNRYNSASEYFNYLLTKDDIIDLRKTDSSMSSYGSFTSELYGLKSKYDIVEFSPYQYISIHRLNENGVTAENLTDYCNAVRARVEKNEFFTIHSLRRKGFVHPLEDLGFDDWFYASVIAEDKQNFSYIRLSNTKLFCRTNKQLRFESFLFALLLERSKIDIYDLMELLEQEYGLKPDRHKLFEHIEKAGLYYDKIMETVYIDYNTYFEEI